MKKGRHCLRLQANEEDVCLLCDSKTPGSNEAVLGGKRL